VQLSLIFITVSLGLYLLVSRLILRSLRGMTREVCLALVNLIGIQALFFYDPAHQWQLESAFIFYILIVLFQYGLLRWFSPTKSQVVWPAFFAPILILITFRYVPDQFFSALEPLFGLSRPGLPYLIGLSYLAFRCSRLVLEVRNGSVKMPGLWEYLGFSFFLPTMQLGPINTYTNYRRGFEAVPWPAPVGRSALRVLVGLIKYEFLGGMLNQLTYTPWLINGHQHLWIDLPLAMVFYYLYLYCNFSGFCDMAIGAAALVGIPVLENFNNPLTARNLKDFWNRWHITLSEWMRDILFAPLSKYLVRVMGPGRVNHALALAIFAVFLLIGIWHGVGLNYAVFGLLQAVGVVTTHYYTLWLKQRLGRERFKAYNENRWIHAAAVAITFCYFAASLLFFANTGAGIKAILHALCV
jgi:D-alanyl-lipoteichoic acid acyltransferase DltB (MBOAT superfamily)